MLVCYPWAVSWPVLVCYPDKTVLYIRSWFFYITRVTLNDHSYFLKLKWQTVISCSNLLHPKLKSYSPIYESYSFFSLNSKYSSHTFTNTIRLCSQLRCRSDVTSSVTSSVRFSLDLNIHWRCFSKQTNNNKKCVLTVAMPFLQVFFFFVLLTFCCLFVVF